MDSIERDVCEKEHRGDKGEVYIKIDKIRPSNGIREDSPIDDPVKIIKSSFRLSGQENDDDDYDDDDDDMNKRDDPQDDDNVNVRPDDDDEE
jgi:hypothetical protein